MEGLEDADGFEFWHGEDVDAAIVGAKDDEPSELKLKILRKP